MPSYIAHPNSECTIHRKKDNEMIHINPIKLIQNNNNPTYYEYKLMETKKEYVFAMDDNKK